METRKDLVFRAVADPTRRAILELMATSPKGLAIRDIAGSFGSSRQAVTKHLDVLSSAGLILTERRGRERVCQPQLQELKCLYEWVSFYEQFWTAKLQKLGEHLDNS